MKQKYRCSSGSPAQMWVRGQIKCSLFRFFLPVMLFLSLSVGSAKAQQLGGLPTGHYFKDGYPVVIGMQNFSDGNGYDLRVTATLTTNNGVTIVNNFKDAATGTVALTGQLANLSLGLDVADETGGSFIQSGTTIANIQGKVGTTSVTGITLSKAALQSGTTILHLKSGFYDAINIGKMTQFDTTLRNISNSDIAKLKVGYPIIGLGLLNGVSISDVYNTGNNSNSFVVLPCNSGTAYGGLGNYTNIPATVWHLPTWTLHCSSSSVATTITLVNGVTSANNVVLSNIPDSEIVHMSPGQWITGQGIVIGSFGAPSYVNQIIYGPYGTNTNQVIINNACTFTNPNATLTVSGNNLIYHNLNGSSLGISNVGTLSNYFTSSGLTGNAYIYKLTGLPDYSRFYPGQLLYVFDSTASLTTSASLLRNFQGYGTAAYPSGAGRWATIDSIAADGSGLILNKNPFLNGSVTTPVAGHIYTFSTRFNQFGVAGDYDGNITGMYEINPNATASVGTSNAGGVASMFTNNIVDSFLFYSDKAHQSTTGLVEQGNSFIVNCFTKSSNGRYLVVPGSAGVAYDSTANNQNGNSGSLFANATAVRLVTGDGQVKQGFQATNTTNSFQGKFQGVASEDGTLIFGQTVGQGMTVSYPGNTKTPKNIYANYPGSRFIRIVNGHIVVNSSSQGGAYFDLGPIRNATNHINSADTTTNAFNAIVAASWTVGSAPYGFAMSPDAKTLYAIDGSNGSTSTAGGLYRGTFVNGNWSFVQVVSDCSSFFGIDVDWSSYNYNATGANGAVIYITEPQTVFKVTDAGSTRSSWAQPVVLATFPFRYIVKALALAPSSQTLTAASTPAATSIDLNQSKAVYAFTITPNEGNSSLTTLTIKNKYVATGSNVKASLKSDFSSFSLAYSDGSQNGTLTSYTATDSTITFSGLSLTIAPGTPLNFTLSATSSATATVGAKAIFGFNNDKTITNPKYFYYGSSTADTSFYYTTSIVNKGLSWVYLGTNGTGSTVDGNLITVATVSPYIQSTVTSVTVPGVTYSNSNATMTTSAGTATKVYITGGNFSSNATVTVGVQNSAFGYTSDYEVSHDGTFSNSPNSSKSISFTPTVNGTTITDSFYIRFRTGLDATKNYYNETITISATNGGQSDNYTLSASGDVFGYSPTLSTDSIRTISSSAYCPYSTIPTLKVTVTDDGTSSTGTTTTNVTYQWYSNPTAATVAGGTAISGGTSSSYTPSGSTPGSSFYYICRVTNTATGIKDIATTYPVTVSSSYGYSSSLSNQSVHIATNAAVLNKSVPAATYIDYTNGGVANTAKTQSSLFVAKFGTAVKRFKWQINGVDITTVGSTDSTQFDASNVTGVPSRVNSTAIYTSTGIRIPSSLLNNGDVVNVVASDTSYAYGCVSAYTPVTMIINVPNTTKDTFTSGNFVAYRNGDGTNNPGSAANHSFIDQFNGWGSANQSPSLTVALPYSTGVTGLTNASDKAIYNNSDSNNVIYPQNSSFGSPYTPYSCAGSNFDLRGGYINLSTDGKFVLVPGYNLPYLQSSVSGSATNTIYGKANYRTLGFVYPNGVVDVPFANSFLSGQTFVGAVSDGTQIWATGGTGFFYYQNSADLAGTGYAGNTVRTSQIFNGKIFTSSANTSQSSPDVGINSFGNISLLKDQGSATTSLVTTNYTGTTGGNSPNQFVFNPTGDVLYVADDATGVNVFKSTDLVNYTFAYRLYANGAYGIIGDFSRTNPRLIVSDISYNIVAIDDNGSSTSSSITTLATPPGNLVASQFKGLAWAPSNHQVPYIYVNKNFKQAAFNSTFPTTFVGSPSTNIGNNVLGVAVKFPAANVTVKASPCFEISETSTFSTLYDSSKTLSFLQSDLVETSVNSIKTVYVRFNPSKGYKGAVAGNITFTTTYVDASGNTQTLTNTVAVSGTVVTSTALYLKPLNSDLSNPHNYTDDQTLVAGNRPAVGTTMSQLSGVKWIINSGFGYQLNNDITLGSNSVFQIGDTLTYGSVSLTVPSNHTITGGSGINVAKNGKLIWQNAATPAFNSIVTGSTVQFDGATGTTQTIPANTYSNLTFSSAGNKTLINGGIYTIDSVFTVYSTATNFTYPASFTFYFNGNTLQTLPPFAYNNLTISNNVGCTLGYKTNISVSGNLYIEQGYLNIPVYSTYTQTGTGNISFNAPTNGVPTSLTVGGTFVNGSYNSSALSITTASFIPYYLGKGNANNSQMTFTATGVYNHNGNGGTLPTATWASGSTCKVSGVTNLVPSSGFAQTFSKFIWSNTAQNTSFYLNASGFGTLDTFAVVSTGTGSNYLALSGNASSIYSYSFGNLYADNLYGGLTSSNKVNVYAAIFTNSLFAKDTIKVTGNVSVLNGATVDLANSYTTQSSLTYPTYMTIGGNLNIGTSATFTSSSTGNNVKSRVAFVSTTGSAVSHSYTNSTSTTTSKGINYYIDANSTVSLLSNLTTSTATPVDSINNNGKLGINGKRLSVYGYGGNGSITGSLASWLTFNGSFAPTVKFDQTSNDVTNALSVLNVNTTGTVTVNSNLSIYDTLNPGTGILSIGSNDTITLKSITDVKTAVVGIATNATPFAYASTGVFRVERFIPYGPRFYREIAPSVSTNGSSSIFTDWQEKGAYPTTTGIFITGGAKTSNGIIGFDPTTGFDFDYTGENNIYAYRYKSAYNKYDWDTVTSTKAEIFATPFASYLTLVRGARNFNMFTTPQGGSNVLVNGPGPVQSPTTFRSVGKLGFGTYSLTTTATANTPALNPADSGYTMLGNPYFCPLDWNKVVEDGGFTNLYSSYWYLDPTIANGEKYVVYNYLAATNNVPTYSNGTTQVGSSVNRYIQPGQAFHILTKNPTGNTKPTIAFKESMKAASQAKTSVFSAQPTYSKISITLWRPNTSNVYRLMDGAVIVFGADLSNSLSDADSKKRDAATDNLSIAEKGTNLSIDGRLPAKSSDKINLYLGQLLDQTNYNLKVNTLDYTDPSQDPYLFDSYTNTTTALLRDSVNTVSFTTNNSIPATSGNRYSIIFKPTVLPITNITLSGSVVNNKTVINWEVVGESNTALYTLQKSYDGINFVTVENVKALGKTVSQYGLTDAYTSKTVYYRVVANQDGKEVYSNVVEISPVSLSSFVSVFPNPVTGGKFAIRLSNVLKSNYDLILTDNIGKVVYKRTIEHNGGDVSYPIQLQEGIASGVYHVSIKGSSDSQAKVFETQLFINNK